MWCMVIIAISVAFYWNDDTRLHINLKPKATPTKTYTGCLETASEHVTSFLLS